MCGWGREKRGRDGKREEEGWWSWQRGKTMCVLSVEVREMEGPTGGFSLLLLLSSIPESLVS
jgi:hypothetical protein